MKQEINLYPEMNEEIKKLLHGSKEPYYQYILARIEQLEEENEKLKISFKNAVNDIKLLDERGWLCKWRDGGACIKSGKRELCTYGSASKNPCKKYVWRGECEE